jgi:hypothetical protein
MQVYITTYIVFHFPPRASKVLTVQSSVCSRRRLLYVPVHNLVQHNDVLIQYIREVSPCIPSHIFEFLKFALQDPESSTPWRNAGCNNRF